MAAARTDHLWQSCYSAKVRWPQKEGLTLTERKTPPVTVTKTLTLPDPDPRSASPKNPPGIQ